MSAVLAYLDPGAGSSTLEGLLAATVVLVAAVLIVLATLLVRWAWRLGGHR